MSDVKLAMLGRISLATQLDEGHSIAIRRHNEEVDRNLHILSKIIDAVIFCRAFELASRGHDESDVLKIGVPRTSKCNPQVLDNIVLNIIKKA
jgi:hypothetical protein